MQIVSLSKYEQKEGDVAPLEGDLIVCPRLQEEGKGESRLLATHPSSPAPPPAPASLAPSTTTTTMPPHHHNHLQQGHYPHHNIPSGTPTCDIPGNTRKRKCEEEEEEASGKEMEERVRQYIGLVKRRALADQRERVAAGLTALKLPLCHVYSDLLRLLPRVNMGGGGQGRGRRKSPMPDFSTPIDSSHQPLEPASRVYQTKTPPLYHVQDSVDSQSLEERGFSQEWFANVLQLVIKDMNKYGVCVVDDFLGVERAERILDEVEVLHSLGVFQAGQVVSRHVQDHARGKIRGDSIAWVTGTEAQCSAIGQLVSVVDSLVANANKHQDAGKLAQYNITWRTRAMVACYPGRDSHYVKHIDNPNGDGRCITAIYYLNRQWTETDGGVLRIYPEDCSDLIAAIEPCFDRMLFFWSDKRNPHEVLPAKIKRYAITVWYLDQKEREEYLSRESMGAAACT